MEIFASLFNISFRSPANEGRYFIPGSRGENHRLPLDGTPVHRRLTFRLRDPSLSWTYTNVDQASCPRTQHTAIGNIGA